MSATRILEDAGSSARRRRASSLAALALPWILAACALAWRIAGVGGLAVALIVGAAMLVAIVTVTTRHLDAAWAARQLDERRADLEDSAGLLLAPLASPGPLQRLQRARIERRLADAPPPDLRPAWPGRALALSWMLGAALAATALLLTPSRESSSPERALAPSEHPAITGVPQLVEQRLDIEPPAYTGLPARTDDTLDAKVPTGSRLRWRLRFEPQPDAVELVFHDQTRVTLAATAGAWTAQRTIDRSTLYRVVLDGATSSVRKRHRIDVVADQPPSITTVTPTQNVTLHEAGQRHWLLQFEARDDYGLGPARLHLTLAQGGGENVAVTERTLAIRGMGDRKQRQYTQRLDLESLGLAPGDDLIVRFSVDDNRQPTPQSARSASLILRWPPGAGDEPTGMEGMVRKTLPAYFRSQRQVIIDTEALIGERGKGTVARFNDRSDAIGLDQRLLRLRYGQFLGEEAEDFENAAGQGHDEHTEAPEAERVAADAAVLEKFGHMHDIPEAATLLDRETRELLRSALREMWQAELHLRQGQPARALPYEYRALDRIKQVQQATRIYLARVGLELPPIDESRRLAGDAAGVRSRGDALAASTTDSALPAQWWARLDPESQLQPADLAALASWVRARETQLPQAIELLAAIEALRDDARCDDCRQQLRALLWPLLPTPPTSTSTRATTTAAGAAYLDALQSEAAR